MPGRAKRKTQQWPDAQPPAVSKAARQDASAAEPRESQARGASPKPDGSPHPPKAESVQPGLRPVLKSSFQGPSSMDGPRPKAQPESKKKIKARASRPETIESDQDLGIDEGDEDRDTLGEEKDPEEEVDRGASVRDRKDSSSDGEAPKDVPDVGTKALAEYIDEAMVERRSAPSGLHYMWREFLDWYGDYNSAFIPWSLGMAEDRSVWEDSPQAMLLRRLFPRSVPNRILHDATTGRLHPAAAEVVSSSTVDSILVQLMWMRFSQYEVEVLNGGVGEPVVTKDLFRPRPLTDEENVACMAANFDDTYDQAWQRWRDAWKANIELTPEQQAMKRTAAPNVFNRRARSWFSSWVKQFVGDTHLAKGIIRCGYQNLKQVERLVQAILLSKKTDVAPPCAPLEVHHARRREALKARDQMRYARSISRRVENGELAWNNLAGWQQDLWYSFEGGRLEAELDAKNAAYKEVMPECQEMLGAALDILKFEDDLI